MTASNLPAALAFILEDEGPELNIGGSEPGGGSKYGVSMVNLIDWNAARSLPKPTLDDLAKMTPDFANQIYTETFAKPLRFNDLPTGFDYQLLNISVNLGLHGGGRLAQAVLGIWQGDGTIDDATVLAAAVADHKIAAMMLGAAWIAVKRQSPNWGPSPITPHGYGHGWTNSIPEGQRAHVGDDWRMTMTFSLLWLPGVLRAWGLNVIEVPGWQNRGHGDEGKVLGVLCFTSDAVVLTRRGLISIADVIVGDEVWTHKNRWRSVTAVGHREASLHLLKGHGHPGLLTTAEHPFLAYARERRRSKGKKVRRVVSKGWVRADEMRLRWWCSPSTFGDDRAAVPTIVSARRREKIVRLSTDLMWVLGYWLGDGYCNLTERRGAIALYANLRDVVHVERMVRRAGFACSVQPGLTKSVKVIRLSSRPLAVWFTDHFGKLAHGKTIPSWALQMRREWREAFLSGYLTADGGLVKQQANRSQRRDAVTVSKRVAIGVKLLAQSLGLGTALYLRTPPATKVLNGRLVNQRPFWIVRITEQKPTQERGRFLDGYFVAPCRRSVPLETLGAVYNISVADDESYVADGLIVHNCHHTCGPLHGNLPDLNVLVDGRPDLGGPLCNLGLGRDGTFYMIAAGKGWHAGAGNWQGVTDGNGHLIGIEAENTGETSGPRADVWPDVQMNAYKRGVAAILTHIGASPAMCAGHKEFATPHGRKDDPDFDMVQFRADVAKLMAPAAPSVA